MYGHKPQILKNGGLGLFISMETWFVRLTICNIPEEWHKSHSKVNYNIEHHLGLDVCWETSFDLGARAVNHHGHECINDISDSGIDLLVCANAIEQISTYPGMMPITELQPNLIPMQLKRLMSRRYARRLTFVRTFASWGEIPGGRALRLFVVLDEEGFPSSLVAGTVSKYGS